METTTYTNISQRAADSFRRLLAEPDPSSASQTALHAFFTSFYESLFQHPEQFGLPLTPDLSIAEDEPNAKDKKQEVKRALDKPRGMILAALDFLLLAGAQGSLEGQFLLLNDGAAALQHTKISKKFLAGLEAEGLTLTLANDTARLHHTRFPDMLPALQALAISCATFEPALLGKFQFSRCEFRAFHNAAPEPTDLYRAFTGSEHTLVMQLHEFFTAKGYTTTFEGNNAFAWVVKYQGSRKVKATPLFQIEYDDRHARPLRMMIKCASTPRIAPLLPQQSQLLQDDFSQRVFPCNGDACGWCRNKKTLGPTLLTHNGVSRTVCWYTNPDIRDLNHNTFDLVRQYEHIHAHLADPT